ncbi:glycosyltransferase family 2 protein [Thiobacillus sp.]|uniref:glycosyltransferase family 2 protein n=1 Tax=Thiobacillus sp. TaxID=924 RepID=UPI0025F4E1B5|nr:glycosyltransferase family 2 protein [Thiobacillus sp.]MBT9540096.1 glycosyltransferase family 2 protein [Thiobacillus sp.]
MTSNVVLLNQEDFLFTVYSKPARGRRPIRQHLWFGAREINTARSVDSMSSTPILISIVIPTWNRPVLLGRLVELINAENEAGDIEVVIVDDCSEEKNWKLLQDIAASNLNVKLYRNATNIGMTRNWNKAIEYARGQWIGFMCDDDLFKPDSIERIRKLISTTPKPCLILQNSSISFESEWIEPGVAAANRVALPPASGQFWHREITEKLGAFDERVKYCPDAEFWLRLAYHYPVLLVRDYLVIPYQHDTNYMWEIFRRPDFLEQVTLSITISSQWLLGENATDRQLVQYQIDDGIWETLRTVLNNTFLKSGEMKNFPRYLIEFIRYSFVMNRKRLMVKTIARLPLLRAKDFLRPIANQWGLLKK